MKSRKSDNVTEVQFLLTNQDMPMLGMTMTGEMTIVKYPANIFMQVL